jgi:hypothetical protein
LVFKVKVPGPGLEIEILDIDQVHIHEEIVPELLRVLLEDLKSRRMVMDPLLIDKKTKVVLDGMHRLAALKKMGYRYLPVCGVNYKSPKVKVGCWYRVIEGRNWGKFPEILKLLGLKGEKTTIEHAKRKLEDRRAVAALWGPGGCLLIRAERNDIHESYGWIKRIERALKEEGFKLRYERERDAEPLVSKRTSVLLVPCAKKNEIIETALSGRVFAHKTTRHVVEGRPLNVRIPLNWLTGRRPLREVNRVLSESLSGRKFECIPAGSFFKGKRLEGGVTVFR